MKIKKVIALCKASESFINFYDNRENQWLSDGNAAYLLNDMPELTEEFICKAYDINDKARKKIIFRTDTFISQRINLSDSTENETPVKLWHLSLNLGDYTVVPISTESGLFFILEKYLQPLSDYNKEDISVFARTRSDGGVYFAIKIGLFINAIISPYKVINQDFVKQIEELYTQTIAMWENVKESKADDNELV